MWQVWGRDTFAREDYFIGAFATEAEACACARRHEERLAQTQDEPLRDEVWVQPPPGGGGGGAPPPVPPDERGPRGNDAL